MDAARYAHGGATVIGDTVDLLDLDQAREWADRTEKEFGRIDGLVHLVGGWRGSSTFSETDLTDWDVLHKLLVRTVQHTSLAFYDALERSGNGRFLLTSAAGASKPTGATPPMPPPRPRPRPGRWQWRTASARQGEQGPRAAAAILIVKALVNDQMRAERPNAKFAGFTDVTELAEAIAGVWSRPAQEVNGQRLWLTPEP